MEQIEWFFVQSYKMNQNIDIKDSRDYDRKTIQTKDYDRKNA